MREGSTTKRKSVSSPVRSTRTRENQLANLAMELAERKLRDGTASSQVITHFLKLATVREELELERIRSDLEVAKAKVKKMESDETLKETYEKALEAMKRYSGQADDNCYYEEYDEY